MKAKKVVQKVVLNLENRKIKGKKVRKLRKNGSAPANIYGPNFPSTAVVVKINDFSPVYRQVRETGLLFVSLNKEEVPVLISHVQRHPVSGEILHIDFKKVDLTKKTITEVPVLTIGTSQAVAQKGGVLITLTDKLTVEALPQDIPNHIEVDISKLLEIGSEIKVSDLPKVETYEIKTDMNHVIVSVTAHKEESVIAETTTVAPEVITAKPESTDGNETAETTASDKKSSEPTKK